MKRIRLSTMLLLVVIAAMGIGLVTQEMRHRRREAQWDAETVSRVQMAEEDQAKFDKELYKNLEGMKIEIPKPSTGKATIIERKDR
jgi:hypothetical protein